MTGAPEQFPPSHESLERMLASIDALRSMVRLPEPPRPRPKLTVIQGGKSDFPRINAEA